MRLTDLSEADLRVLRLALNRLGEDSKWDGEALALEFSEILQCEPQVELRTSGIEMAEIDFILHGDGVDQEDELPDIQDQTTQVGRPGDLWNLGGNRLLCGNALDADSYTRLLGNEKPQMTFTDPPFNVRIRGSVSGSGKVKHDEFAMASGELCHAEFVTFLKTSLGHAANCSISGAVHFVCCDWRHVTEMHAAGEQVYSQQLNLCVWNKSDGGMGYQSKHELIFVFKVGKAPHINNVALGRYCRNRTNVWDYVSQNALNGTARSKLALHPTVKPVAMIADAIRDCSNRGDLILNPFGGAGTTLLAAERTGRRDRVIELDPTFVDVSIERWQRLTGGTAIRADTGQPCARVASAITGRR